MKSDGKIMISLNSYYSQGDIIDVSMIDIKYSDMCNIPPPQCNMRGITQNSGQVNKSNNKNLLKTPHCNKFIKLRCKQMY